MVCHCEDAGTILLSPFSQQNTKHNEGDKRTVPTSLPPNFFAAY